MGLVADYTRGEPAPIKNDGQSIHDLVIADIIKQYPTDLRPVEGHSSIIDELLDRKHFGLEKYGTILQAHNGRDPLRDALDEMVDLLVYLRQAKEEKLGGRSLKRLYDLTVQQAVTLKFLIETIKSQKAATNVGID